MGEESVFWAALGNKAKLHLMAKVGEDEFEQACTGTKLAGNTVKHRMSGNKCAQCRSIEEKAADEEAEADEPASEPQGEPERPCAVHIMVMGPKVVRCRGVLVGPIEDGRAEVRTRHPSSGVEMQVNAELRVGLEYPPTPWFELDSED